MGGKLLFRSARVLFFARNVRHFFPDAYITCLLAKGTDKVHILDRKDFDGGLVADIKDALRFVERNTRTAYRIEALRRQNIPEYPMMALREAITNAVMHRDWFFDGANVFVEIYTDRIEVISPGSLPKGLTLAQLGRRSIRLNALVSDLLHRIDFIEKAGTGIRRIRDEARELACPEPEFEADSFVTVTFRPNPAVRTATGANRVAGEVTPQVTPQVRLLEAFSGEMSRQRLQEQLDLRDSQHFRKAYLFPALQAGLIEMTIPDKPRSSKQRYRLTATGREHLRQTGESP